MHENGSYKMDYESDEVLFTACKIHYVLMRGWSGGAMELVKLLVPGRLTNLN